MGKPDFGNDLARLSENVSADVGDVLQALREKRTQNLQTGARNKEEIKKGANDAPASLPKHQPADGFAEQERLTFGPTNRASRPASPRKTLLLRPTEHVPRKKVTIDMLVPTKELLDKAILRQQLAEKLPDSQWSIVDEALQQWFKRNGYKSKDEVSANEMSPETVAGDYS